MGYGVSPFGVGPFGVGMTSSMRVVSARAASLNSVAVTFSEPPRAEDPASTLDVLLPSNWSLAVLTPPDAVVRLPQYVIADGAVVTVFFDGVLTYRARYAITVAETVMDSAEEETVEPTERTAAFTALGQPKRVTVAQEQSTFNDLSNPFVPRYAISGDRKLGTFAATSFGALELDSGLAGLAKRVFRRTLTKKGAFLHLPDYGVDLPIKGLLRPTELRKLQQVLLVQVQQEPKVVAAQVSLQPDPRNPGILFVGLRVRSQTGVETNGVVPIDLTEL